MFRETPSGNHLQRKFLSSFQNAGEHNLSISEVCFLHHTPKAVVRAGVSPAQSLVNTIPSMDIAGIFHDFIVSIYAYVSLHFFQKIKISIKLPYSNTKGAPLLLEFTHVYIGYVMRMVIPSRPQNNLRKIKFNFFFL